MLAGNLFDDSASPAQGERFDELLRLGDLVIERIVSSDRLDPRESVQSQDEWVVLVRGSAELEIAGVIRSLAPGDHLFIAAGTPHTVRSATDGTLWLAVHLHPRQPGTAPTGSQGAEHRGVSGDAQVC